MSKIQIDVNQSVTSRLGFEVYPAYDNFALGYLTNVSVEYFDSKDDAKWDYSGIKSPRLIFEFVQHKDAFNDRDRYFVHSELPISNTLSTGEQRTAENIVSSYIEMWKRIKHLWDQYSKYAVKPLDIKVDFDYEIPVSERIETFTKFFNDFAEAFNTYGNNNQSVYADYGGKNNNKLLVMKLVASGSKNAYYAFPTYVGKGFVEPAVFVNGKLKTALKFGIKETPILGTVSVSSNPPVTVIDNISEDVMNLLKNS